MLLCSEQTYRTCSCPQCTEWHFFKILSSSLLKAQCQMSGPTRATLGAKPHHHFSSHCALSGKKKHVRLLPHFPPKATDQVLKPLLGGKKPSGPVSFMMTALICAWWERGANRKHLENSFSPKTRHGVFDFRSSSTQASVATCWVGSFFLRMISRVRVPPCYPD